MLSDPTPARRKVDSEIRASGPLTFARFMEIALYGDGGYYRRVKRAGEDYATSPHMHPSFGALIAGWLFKAWEGLGEPSSFEVVEIGGGEGGLCRDVMDVVLGFGSEFDTRFASALSYRVFDTSPRGLSRGMDELSAVDSVVGCVISNELLDAFPTHVFRIRGGDVMECYVGMGEGGELEFVDGDVSNEEIAYRVCGMVSELPDGYRGEVNLSIGDWSWDVRRILERGYVLTIDYGCERELLYHPLRFEGSLRCYRGHVLGQNPFRDVGYQDITSHVDFTAVDECLRGVGFDKISPLLSQRDFLLDLGFGAYAREVRRKLTELSEVDDVMCLESELRGMNALVDVRGLGSFKVAQYGFDVPPVNLGGLEFSPLFPLPRFGSRHLSLLSCRTIECG